MKKVTLILWVFCAVFFSCSDDDNQTVNPKPDKPKPDDDGNPKRELTITKLATSIEQQVRAVQFIDEQTGFMAGGEAYPEEKAFLLKTTDGGNSWEKVFAEDGFYITGVALIDKNIIMASTNKGYLLRSENGGSTWNKLDAFENDFYMADIRFQDENTGYVVGSVNSVGIIIRSTDGGLNWAPVEVDPITLLQDNPLNTITFAENNTVLLSGGTYDNGQILKSTDGGENWTGLSLSSKVMITDLVIKGNEGFAIGNNGQTNASTEKGELFKTLDKGVSWSKVTTEFDNKLISIDWLGNTLCIVGANKSNNLSDPEFALLSFDGGSTWEKLAHEEVIGGWKDVCFISENKVILVGYKGLALMVTIATNE
ncbi:YCF48-related protein [Rapidithrix thailandica]|uniref:YCF48-related protein n=1 Tax=Rapidithrix thailandica TaxID=413964 RepID=A0AAW9RQ12_9BACT